MTAPRSTKAVAADLRAQAAAVDAMEVTARAVALDAEPGPRDGRDIAADLRARADELDGRPTMREEAP